MGSGFFADRPLLSREPTIRLPSREATLFQTARFPIRGLVTNGLMVPLNRSDTPNTDQLRRERSFVENVAKSRKPRKKQNEQVKVIKSTTIKTHEVSKTIGLYEATMSGAVYYKNTFEPALKSKRAPVFVRGSRHSHHRMTEQQKRSTQAERQMDSRSAAEVTAPSPKPIPFYPSRATSVTGFSPSHRREPNHAAKLYVTKQQSKN